MPDTWTLSELVAEAATRLAALPPPKNGQVRAVPDERTIRYYGSIGLLDRPAAMRGRTALYDQRHLAQVVAIKRMQSAGHSLADIQALWPTLDELTLARLSGVEVAPRAKATRSEFWKREPVAPATPAVSTPRPRSTPTSVTTISVALAAGATLVIDLPEDTAISLAPADVRAIRAAAASLVAELANRGLTARSAGTLEEEP